ncbi:MAG: squalene/phytoene synthase family protein [Phycisphaerales bacterium]
MSTTSLDPSRPTLDMLESHGPGKAADAPTLDAAMTYVRGLAKSHYENFHVLTGLVPAELRDDFAAVYAFCRWADDLGDETGSTPEARTRSLELLAWWREGLKGCFAWAEARASEPSRASDRSCAVSEDQAGPKIEGLRPSAQTAAGASAPPTHPVYVALAETIRKRRATGDRALTITPFDDLIKAFELDQTLRQYETWEQLVHYCTLSANPVGRIVLALAGYGDTAENAERYAMSDSICTALQLTNHWQDVRRDLLERDRVYIPSSDTGVSPEQLRAWAERGDDPAARVPYIRMLRTLVARTWSLFERGAPLPGLLDRRIRGVVWLFAAGGRRVLGSVERRGCTTLWNRPTLSGIEKGVLLARAWMTSKW